MLYDYCVLEQNCDCDKCLLEEVQADVQELAEVEEAKEPISQIEAP